MKPPRESAGRFLTAAMIVFSLVVVPMAAYVGGYYALAQYNDSILMGTSPQTYMVTHYYRYRWQADLFKLAGRVEAWLTGNDVEVLCFDDIAVDSMDPK